MSPLVVVVVTHRADTLLDGCLASLAAQQEPPDSVIVVVSNSERIVKLGDLPGEVVQLGENVAYARAVHAGVARRPGHHVLVLNDDTTLAPDCLAQLRQAWRGEAVYQPCIKLADGSGRLDNLGHGFFPDGAVWARGRAGTQPPEGVPGGLSGAAVLIHRGVWDQLGGFDTRLESYGEDVDFSLRLMRRGLPVIPVIHAVVYHHLGATFGRGGSEKVRNIERNRVRAAVRSLPASALLTMPLWTAGRYGLVWALARSGRGPGGDVAPGAARAALSGVAQGLREAPRWWQERAEERASWSRGELGMWRAMWQGRVVWEDLCRRPW